MSANERVGFSESEVKSVLTRLGDLLSESNEKVEIAVAGGIVALLYFKNRLSTKDIDAIFPQDPWQKEALKSCIQKVGSEFGFDEKFQTEWMNDDGACIGMKLEPEVTIFEHGGLKLSAGAFEELLALKISSYRNKNDANDAIALMNEVLPKYPDQEELFEKIYSLKQFGVNISKTVMRRRFELIKNAAVSPENPVATKEIDLDMSFG